MARTAIFPWMCGLAGVVGMQIAYYAPRLPERVASHFDAAGNPDGYMERTAFLLLMGGVIFGTLALFSALIWLLPRMPPAMINMPNRGYWLAEPRRRATHASLARHLLGHTVLIVAFLAWLLHAMYRYNTAGGSLPIGIAIAIYLGATAALIIRMYWQFRLPPDPEE